MSAEERAPLRGSRGRRPPPRFATRHAAVVLLLAGAATLGTTLLFGALAQGLARSDYERGARALVRQLADHLALPVLVESTGLIETPVEAALRGESLSAVQVFGDDGRLLYGSGTGPAPEPPLALSRSELGREVLVQRDGDDWTALAEVWTHGPLAGAEDPAGLLGVGAGRASDERVGFVVARFDTSILARQQRSILLGTALIGLVLAAAVAAGSIRLSRRIASPLARLAALAARGPLDPDDLGREPADYLEIEQLEEALRAAAVQRNADREALEQAARRADRVFEASPVPLLVLGPDGRVVRSNQAGQETFDALGPGPDGEDAPPAPAALADLFEDADAIRAALGEALADSAVTIADVPAKGPGGESVIGDVTLRGLALEGPRALVVFHDRTAEIRAAGERRALEEQIRQAQRLEALGVMAGGIAHDFNNQLNVMLGNLSMLREDLAAGADPTELVDDLDASTRCCADLTGQLLSFTRRQPRRTEVFDLAEVLVETCRMLRRTADERIELSCDFDEGLWAVPGDPSQLSQVVVNLCLNAFDAVSPGDAIPVRATNRALSAEEARALEGLEAGPHVAIEVRDTGRGMDAATAARIFDPFFTTKPLGVGSGLGLATAFGIVRSHEGRIAVESVPGEGTTVSVLLPASPGVCVPARPERVDGPAMPPGRAPTILVTEDEDRLRRATEQLLARRGFAVVTAADGEEALEVFRARRGEVDLLITDLVMPRVGGGTLIGRVRELAPDLPVIAVTGYDHPEEAEHLERHLDVPVLRKPYEIHDLVAEIQRLLGAQAAREAAGPTGAGCAGGREGTPAGPAAALEGGTDGS